MSNKITNNHRCQSCVRLCDEAKDKSLRLEKKVYVMTIALTSALTLLGTEAVEEITAIVRGVEDITESQRGESTEAEEATSADGVVGTIPRTRPFEQKPSVTPQTNAKSPDGDNSKSDVVGISDNLNKRGANKGIMDVVNGKMPSIGELATMPVSPIRTSGQDQSADDLEMPTVSYLESYVADPNARFVTDSPFGGYDPDEGLGFRPESIPTPAAFTVLGVVPLLGSRRRR